MHELRVSLGAGDSTVVRLLDESMSGLSVLIASSIVLRVGQELQLKNGCDSYVAVVRNITNVAEGRRVSLELAY